MDVRGGVLSRPSGEARLRDDVAALVSAALTAVEPRGLVERSLAERTPDPGESGRLIVLAAGKAALTMADGARRRLGRRIDEGVLLVPHGTPGAVPEGFTAFWCGHPLPDQESLEGSRTLVDAARRAGPADRILLLLSGGASACLTLPDGDVTLDDLRRVTGLLLEAGAPIQDLNAVRKHLDRVKGGQLARAAEPARLSALVLSDVPGDRLDVIASGPVSPDTSTFAEAIEVLERHGVWKRAPEAVRRHLVWGREGVVPETPKAGDPSLAGVDVRVIGSAAVAVEAARAEAARKGYRTVVLSTDLTGEARTVGARLARHAREVYLAGDPVAPPACLLAGGETTVTVTGDGRGGRNQELALASALEIDGLADVLVASVGTDGVDGPTDAAGAMATGTTVSRARARGLDPADHLARNDAHTFFAALDDLVVTGPTGTNVMDLMIALVGTSPRGAGSDGT